MARVIDFETEFPKISNSYLSQEQRHQFFEKLKQVVVIVNTEIRGTSEGTLPTEPIVLRGAGVIIDKNGTILTSAYLVPDNTLSIRVRREVDENFWEANREGKMPKHDLAILVPKKNVCAFDFATFDEEERFDIGKEVLCISHTANFMYTLMIGHLACQDHRLARDVEDDPKNLAPLSLGGDLKLMQINNFHGWNNAMGAPVFSSSGRLIGLSTFVWKEFDFAVHLTVLKDFYRSYKKGKGKKK
ncbi:uncharacterized protein LOC131327120 [Rhododendron vialii]|uniref:uncharacterized protein LOC131327120 n=1 Tax=Rhododendron vialii TaxID=182163 RepID=UPI00266021EF|nr:uncharacterized protein LOC131327120 [Rhododendron vialii]